MARQNRSLIVFRSTCRDDFDSKLFGVSFLCISICPTRERPEGDPQTKTGLVKINRVERLR
jgi:hypothetical protein